MVKNYQLGSLNKKWEALMPERKLLEEYGTGSESLSDDDSVIRHLTKQRILWSEKLNKLSLGLPSGVWFNEITLSPKDVIIKGSVVSLQKEAINQINRFISFLKNDASFSKDFEKWELTSVQTRVVGGYDIEDFSLVGTYTLK